MPHRSSSRETARSGSTLSSRTSYKSITRSLKPKVYGDIYSSFELPGTKIYRSDELYHGLVLLSDNKGFGYPARIELTPETLTVQLPKAFGSSELERLTESIRTVTISRHPDGGLGFSIKETNFRVVKMDLAKFPFLCLRYQKCNYVSCSDAPLFIGDTIIAINDELVEGKTHDEVVQMLHDSGTMSTDSRRNGSNGDKISQASDHENFISLVNVASDIQPPKGWKNFVVLPLQMAYITRYLWGTDKLRSNGFEVRSVDGSSSGVIHCEDPKVLSLWVGYIDSHISELNSKSIKLSNKYLHPDELIVYLGWLCERVNVTNAESGDFLKTWEPRFVMLKGNEFYLFETPPLSVEELKFSLACQKILETRFRDLKEHEKVGKREHCFIIETVFGESLYLSVESSDQFVQLRGAWQRCTYYAINKLETYTFACAMEDRPSAIIFDIRHGIGMYDVPTKKYLRWYKFSELQSSADDGKLRIRLVFYNKKFENNQHVLDLDCTDFRKLIFYLHAFLLARIMSVDPDYLNLKTQKEKAVSTAPVGTV
ncbi:Gamma-2-syntrophin [Trichinella pseudospiralis]|uniref:Gamma-2-syntrophin n=1 Tax=Trichinella pseudospiralis TaxID=6337 RepID=A0A0V1K9P4_TRIPS|nr:Gamma-2-syntrophin [Trichinella pseudospiralis]KRZ32694.1 Gamma-2-syntrophin [Trichinella pseudospiralis]KRZ43879.1 Gamma-2-syntrophin [Trichinella pseudospiralis]